MAAEPARRPDGRAGSTPSGLGTVTTRRPDPVGQLGQRVGQQRQRLPAVGIGYQPRHQLLIHPDTGEPRWALDHRAQRLPA